MRRSVTLTVLCSVLGCSGSNSDVGHTPGGAGAPGASAGASGSVATAGGSSSSGGKGGVGGSVGVAGSAVAGGGVSNAGGDAGPAGSAGASGSGVSASGAAGSSGGPSFAQVQVIFDSHCVLCHDKSKASLPSYPALSLVQSDSRAALVNRPALETCGGIYVVPGQPQQSYLIHKLSDNPPCEGVRMPAPFEIIKPPPLSAAELAAIAGWISAGAH
jgi:hypothetical protein